MQSAQPPSEIVWSISALNFEVKNMLNQGIGTIWVEGEISNFASPASGHWYFTLKDDKAQCRAAMFRGRNSRLGFRPENGQKVLVRAQVTLYEARGEFQLVVDHLEDAGIGELMRRYEQLKARLEAEGLFAPSTKKPIPGHPRRIGIVTSTTTAAIRDVLSVIGRRAPHIPVVIYPTPVQGEAAAAEIRRALAQAAEHDQCDVVLLVRGGGSLEDLWCFNDEDLARDIASFPIPLVSGVGHEIDFTIADFVADLRAPTPSVAAESVTPDIQEMMQDIDYQAGRLTNLMELRIEQAAERLKYFLKSLEQQHPTRQFSQLKLRMQHATESLIGRLHLRLIEERQRLRLNQAGLQQASPAASIRQYKDQLTFLLSTQKSNMHQQLLKARHQIDLQLRSLDALNPAKTLARGYATVSKEQSLITSVKQLASGDEIELGFTDGKTEARIK